MIKILKKEKLLEDETIRKTQFENEWYFSLEDMTSYLKEDLSEVESLDLPLMVEGKRETKPTATFENIEKGRKKEELSDFNKKLLKARFFKK